MAQCDYSEDDFLGGKLRMRQPRNGFRSGHDAVLLAASVAASARAVCELGCGVGVAALCVAVRVRAAHITGIDINPDEVRLAEHNAAQNNLASRTRFICGDVEGNFSKLELATNQFDAVIANPPYYQQGQVRELANPQKTRAHIGSATTLTAWVKCATALLAAKGYVSFIHRPEALPDLLAAMTPRFGDIQICPILPRVGQVARRIIVRARRDSKGGLVVLPPLILQTPDNAPTAEAEAILRHGSALAFTSAHG